MHLPNKYSFLKHKLKQVEGIKRLILSMLKINSDTEVPIKKQNNYKVLTLVHNLSSTTKKIISNSERLFLGLQVFVGMDW